MIAVIILFQLRTGLLVRLTVGLGKTPDGLFEILVQFRLGNAAQVVIAMVHRNVVQVVEVAEYAHLPELRNPCQKSELDVAVTTFQCSVETLESVAVLFLKLFVAYCLQHRLVVFIHEYHHIPARLFLRTADDALKTHRKTPFSFPSPVFIFPQFQSTGQFFIQHLGRIIFFSIQIQMQHRIFLPVLFQILDCQSVEQVLPALEIRLQGTHQQALAESAGTGQEIIGSCGNQLV